MLNKGWTSLLTLLSLSCCASQEPQEEVAEIHSNSFSCVGRLAGYYADIESGCQLYHLCDSEGRRYTHSCPNTTLFQQRMMVCDHWYMVDCSKALHDYSANLLLGQRDKPFVSEEEHIRRHPVKDPSAVPSSRRARNRNSPTTLPEQYKNNIFLKTLFEPVTEAEVNQNVLEVHLVDPRHMFYIPEDSAPSSDNATVVLIPVPSAPPQVTSGVMKFRRQHHSSEAQNPSCPNCHPGYLLPGKCEPCVIIR